MSTLAEITAPATALPAESATATSNCLMYVRPLLPVASTLLSPSVIDSGWLATVRLASGEVRRVAPGQPLAMAVVDRKSVGP